MKDFTELRQLIDESGLKFKHIAEKLGITPPSLYNKLSGKTEFTHTEIGKLGMMLGQTDVNRIFFVQNSELNSTKDAT